jgi:hypothetical protein
VALRGVFARNRVYRGVTGWQSFEPWLSRVEAFAASALGKIAEAVPPEWYGGDPRVIEQLMESLLRRRTRLRELIEGVRDSSRQPFPNWGATVSVVVPKMFEETGAGAKFVM